MENCIAIKARWCNLKLLIVVTYLSPTQRVLDNDQFPALVKKLTNMCTKAPSDALTIFLGDFNSFNSAWSRENCRNDRKRTKGEVLKHYTERAKLSVANASQPNFFQGMTETVNDLVFVNRAMLSGLNFCETTEHLGGSDHCMIRLQFDFDGFSVFTYKQYSNSWSNCSEWYGSGC